MRISFITVAAGLALSLALPGSAIGQSPPSVQLPTVVVNAQKEPADLRTLPVSVTAVTRQTLLDSGAGLVSEAAMYAPNNYFSEFTARKLSNARFRGIGSSPANPGVTTYLDGVPQLNANTSSIDLLDVEQVELVRGPQSALFGRNTLGGLVNVASTRPSLSEWTGSFLVPLANRASRDVQGSASGPIVKGRLGAGVSLAYGRRDGFTVNAVTGHDVDFRSAFSAKGQILWTPAADWESRVILTGERARDGDYALQDLGALRRTPFQVSRDFEGHTHRDIFGTTVLNRREGTHVSVTSTTGFVRWRTDDATDLDYSVLPFVTRNNEESAFQFTQEVRLASAVNRPVRISDRAALRWQAGVFVFTQDYEQDAANTFAPFLLSPFLGLAVNQRSPQATLDDRGVGLYGQATMMIGDRVDVSAGVRLDHENKTGVLNTFYTPAIAPPRNVTAEKDFTDVSPQFSVAFRPAASYLVYGSVARGFKAGGFNPASPLGREAYDEERAWHGEGGIKATLAAGRVTATAAVFSIDWQDLQLNLPDPAGPGQFYIANVAGATSRGVELEVNARLHRSLDVFGSVGYTRARFDAGSVSSGINTGGAQVPIDGNTVPNTPETSGSLGTQLTRALGDAEIYGRAEVVFFGAFHFDEFNRVGQDAYSLTNLRVGTRRRPFFIEAWVRNTFNTHYVPVAFAYGPLAPSGYIGESGRPRTFGATAGVRF
jgi:iron complex outermembrane receptor protein